MRGWAKPRTEEYWAWTIFRRCRNPVEVQPQRIKYDSGTAWTSAPYVRSLASRVGSLQVGHSPLPMFSLV